MAAILATTVGIWYARSRPPVKDNREFLAALAAFTVAYLAVYKTLLAYSPDFEFVFWNELPL